MICTNHPDVVEGVRHCSRCGFAYCGDCLVTIGGLPYCAGCKQEQVLDVRSGVDSTVLDYASIGRRFGAVFVDSCIISLPLLAIVFYMISQTGFKTTPAMLGRNPLWYLPAVVNVIYQAAMLKARGQTIGKIAMKVKVVRVDGDDLTAGQAWGREVLRFVLGFLYIVDYIPAFFTNDKKTLHDMLAATRVVNWA